MPAKQSTFVHRLFFFFWMVQCQRQVYFLHKIITNLHHWELLYYKMKCVFNIYLYTLCSKGKTISHQKHKKKKKKPLYHNGQSNTLGAMSVIFFA